MMTKERRKLIKYTDKMKSVDKMREEPQLLQLGRSSTLSWLQCSYLQDFNPSSSSVAKVQFGPVLCPFF